MNLNELYTQVITENSRSKENRHPVEGATHSLEGVNPSCGDDITLQLRVKNGVIEDIFPPCGVCRQVMQEFCAPDFMIYMGRSDGTYVAESLGAMLPYGFTADKYMK